MSAKFLVTIGAIGLMVAALIPIDQLKAQEKAPMTFFVTSVGLGKGGDLGGLAGADKQCQSLATAAGAANKTWRAYLSTTGEGGVNAKDRIGKGPWHNASGELIGKDIEELLAGTLWKQTTAQHEKGQVVGNSTHDMLTGTTRLGLAHPMNCKNWTSDSSGEKAVVGHSNITHNQSGAVTTASWGSAHPTLGCDKASLWRTAGDGFFYCFAAE